MGPASTVARMDVCSDPTASRTLSMSSVHSSHVGMALRGTPSDAPVPRRSKKINRRNDANRLRKSAMTGSSHAISTLLPSPLKKSRSEGPSPRTW